MSKSGRLFDAWVDVNFPTTPTSTCFPAGTSTRVSRCFVPLPLPLIETGTDSTLPPSLPMISLVIANLNPRDLMQLARLGIEVVIPRDRVRNIHRFAHARKERRACINQRSVSLTIDQPLNRRHTLVNSIAETVRVGTVSRSSRYPSLFFRKPSRRHRIIPSLAGLKRRI